MERRACGIIACACCPSLLHVVVSYLPPDIHPVHDRAIVCLAMHHRMRSGLPSCSKQSRRLRQLFRGWQKCRVWAFAVHVEATSADQAYGLIGLLSKHLHGNVRSELASVSVDHDSKYWLLQSQGMFTIHHQFAEFSMVTDVVSRSCWKGNGISVMHVHDFPITCSDNREYNIIIQCTFCALCAEAG